MSRFTQSIPRFYNKVNLDPGGMEMSTKQAELLLITVIALRSTSLLFSKIALATMGPLTLLGLRFLLAFVILAAIFFKRLTAMRLVTLGRGLALGGLFFATMVCELLGLQYTSSGTTAFLENTAILLVPLFDALLRRVWPNRSALVSGALALTGIAFLTVQGGRLALGRGELLCLLAALFYAATIVATDRLAKRDDAVILGVLQVGCIGVLGTAAAFVFEQPALPSAAAEWGSVIFLALICTVLGFTMQPVAQKYTSTEKAGLYCALNPLIAAVLGCIFLHEDFGLKSFIGAALILSGIAASSLLGRGMSSSSAQGQPAAGNC